MSKKNANRLAGLAALAGAAYMATRDKDKDMGSTRAARPESTETREEPLRQITDYMKKPDGGSKSITEADVVMPEKMTLSPAANLSSKPSQTYSPPANTVSSSEEGMKNYKPRRTPSTVSSSEEGMKNYKPRRTPAASFASGGMTVSRRADGIAQRGKTRGKMC